MQLFLTTSLLGRSQAKNCTGVYVFQFRILLCGTVIGGWGKLGVLLVTMNCCWIQLFYYYHFVIINIISSSSSSSSPTLPSLLFFFFFFFLQEMQANFRATATGLSKLLGSYLFKPFCWRIMHSVLSTQEIIYTCMINNTPQCLLFILKTASFS